MKVLPSLVLLVLLLTSVYGMSKNNHLNLYTKDSSWEVIEGAWGRLNYNEDFVFNGHGLPVGNEYKLITYGGWNDIECLGEGVVNEEGNIHISGVTPTLKSDDVNIPVKVWLVPYGDASCDLHKMLAWHQSQILFEE